jgi:lipopolysaccharide/colanic/teichoic acid biosynthesis glycosyltransferase
MIGPLPSTPPDPAAAPAAAIHLGKRCLDLVLASLMLIVLAPLMALVALLIRLDSRGPALYCQPRIGREGKPFTLWKFRSMYQASSDHPHRRQSLEWFTVSAAPDGYKNRPDPRITRVGRTLRRTSLDELPQLFNVLWGDMSLVGPRPLMPYDRPLYEPWQFERETVRPGITGLWQTSGRDRVSAQEMMTLDVRYVREWSFGLDLKILALTLPTVLADAGRPRSSAAGSGETATPETNLGTAES